MLFYKNITTGYNQFTSERDNFELILIIADIAEVIESFHAKIDAWYLDGFSPAKNPEMWSKKVFSFMKKNSKKGASFATYTTAGFVKEGLAEAGFTVEKILGFGNKKHMLKGILPIIHQKLSDKPWFRIPKFTSMSKHAVIIGGGIAGTSLSYTLAEKGFTITLVEKENKFDNAPFDSLAGMFAPLLTGDPSDLSDWSLIAYKEFTRFLNLYENKFSGLFGKTGVFQTAISEEEITRQEKALRNSKLSSSDAVFLEKSNSVFRDNSGIFFPNAGWINPFHLSHTYLKLAGSYIKQIISTSAIRLERNNTHWKIYLSNNDVLESEIVILANSYDAKDFVQCMDRIKKVRGQILYYPSKQFPIQLDSVVLHDDGYIIPNKNGMHIIGSTFNPNDPSPEVNIEHNVHLLQNLKNLIPQINPLDGRNMSASVGFRAMSTDHLPLIGPVPDEGEFLKNYHDLWKSNIYKEYPDGKYIPGLYLSVAHGSKGILNSYLAANVLASMIVGDAQIIPSELIQKINPARFLIQSFIK